jgi:hypothetical protein
MNCFWNSPAVDKMCEKVISMKTEVESKTLKKLYPEGLSKEQFYKLCHVSKRTARYLLDTGLVPCQRREQQTHRYKIAVDDVLEYLNRRETEPERYAIPKDKPLSSVSSYRVSRLLPYIELRLLTLYQAEMSQLPDTLTVQDVSKTTGYSVKTIIRWCRQSTIHSFLVKRTYRIPKECLLAFMMSARFRKISVKSDRHKSIIRNLMETASGI